MLVGEVEAELDQVTQFGVLPKTICLVVFLMLLPLHGLEELHLTQETKGDKMARKKKPGTVVCIDLGNGFHTYARELQHPFVAVYDARTDETMQLDRIITQPTLFIVGVFDRAFKRWKEIGYIPLNSNELLLPDRFIQDVINPENCRIIDANGNERSATPQECERLESASIWDSDEIIDRINDYYDGRTSFWVESLKVKLPNDGINE
jgi:Immunity protein 26